MRRRDFIRLLGGAAVDVCIDCDAIPGERWSDWTGAPARVVARRHRRAVGTGVGLGESRRRRSLWLLVAVRNVRQREVWSSLPCVAWRASRTIA